jgi:lauroyl/myristoyl acyltransferase
MEVARRKEGLFSWSDVARLAKLLTGGLAAALIPHRYDDSAAELLLRFYPAARPVKIAELAATMADALSARRSGDWQALAEEHARMAVEDSWGRFRGIGQPGRWRPTIEFSGKSHVRDALERGRGAVIWCMRFSSDIVLKQAFHQMGLPLVHLSLAEHGAWGSRTKLGTSVISPLFTRAENPYLADRVIIPPSSSLRYLQTLREHLRTNACVSIFGDRTGRQRLEVPFLNGCRKFATGAPSLAWVENCALLSAYVIRTGVFQYRVVIEEQIPVDRSLNRKEFLKRAVEEFAQRMEELVERYPADWQEWADWKRSQH